MEVYRASVLAHLQLVQKFPCSIGMMELAQQLVFITAVSSAAPAVATTQANTLSGSSLSQAPSLMYGNRLNPNSSMAALIAQSENNPTDQDLGDNSRNLVGRGSSPRGSLSPRSPVSSLQIRYDQPGNSSLENLPPVAASIEQLLERQWSEGQQFLLEQGTPSDRLETWLGAHIALPAG
uniref:Testis cDNA clone: QtsA-11453, similar to human myeloid/lymphoid or mixed-lineage leukemia (trithoraxhomolog, Drosophila); translocated to, 10 (MLLT10) n=1 Tax=Macaca fascicularis TaxID=9541 RepID=Q4R4A4_MACFA|nr:unnamed protein product [Macaca fascicularis]